MKSMMFKCLLLLYFSCVIHNCVGDECLYKASEVDENEQTVSPQLRTKICPGVDDPPEFNGCCSTLNTNSSQYYYEFQVECCATEQPPRLFYFISDRLALLLAVALTLSLLVITIVIVVCCFWTRCPLYMSCRVRYRRDDIIAYASKDEETDNLNEMPPEEKNGIKTYSLNDVKITPLKDSA